MRYVLLALLWVIWCSIHSGMISVTAIKFSKHRLGAHYRFYRLAFNLVAVATIIPVLLYGRSLDGQVLFRQESFVLGVQVLMLLASALLFVAGARHYDLLQFLGLRQIRTGASHSSLTECGRLNTSGVLGVIRHPWYLAAVLLVWADLRPLTTATLVTNTVLTIYLVVGTILEERKLVEELGDEYREYQKRVPMLVPVPWRKTAIAKTADK